MKLSYILLIGTFLQASASSYSQDGAFNMHLTKVFLKDAFNEIQRQSDYVLFYSNDELDDQWIVSINVDDAGIDEVMRQLLSGFPLTYQVVDNYVIVKVKSRADQHVSGVVTDADGVPLMGTSILLKGTSKGTVSDADGAFELDIPDDVQNPVLIFSYTGYATLEIPVSDENRLRVRMQMVNAFLQEVVVVGYGTTKKEDLTGTVSTIKAEDIEQIKTQTIDQALVGKVPGVHISALSGQPGAGAIVHVRGLSSLTGDNQPLYVIDGIPQVVNPNFGGIGLGIFGSRENPLLAINPNDVERVDVLKDASAAAIYGSRAANGVILITTKRGKRNTKPQLSLSVNSTLQTPINTWDVLNAAEYREFMTAQARSRIDAGRGTPTDQTIVNDPAAFFGNADTDWQEEITNNNALWNEYRAGVTGGTESINYLISGQVTDQEGIMMGTQFNRYNLSGSLDADITSKLKTGTSFNYNYSVNKTSGVTSLTQGATFRPDVGIFQENGAYTSVPPFGGALGPGVVVRNPVGGAGQVRNERIGQNLFGSVYGELELIKNLKFKSQISVNLFNDATANFSPSFSDAAIFNIFFGTGMQAFLNRQTNDGFTTVFANTLNYARAFDGGHTIDAVAGVSYDRNKLDLESQTYLGFPDDYTLTDIRSAGQVDSYDSQSIESGLNSIFGRVNYNFRDRYLLTFTARRDGSTKFGPNNQYGFFPSGAVAWNLHNENFLAGSSFLSQLKLRASLGRTGSDNLPSFAFLAYIASLENGDSFYGNQNGITVTGLPNPDLRWEATDQFDLGLEFGLFDYRLTGEVVYFTKNTSGIILFTPIPAETGFASYNSNLADVSNSGWEITLGGDVVRNGNFRWNSSFNISFIENNVDNLYGGATSTFGSTAGIQEGRPIGSIFGYQVAAIAQSAEEIAALNSGAPDGSYFSGTRAPGDYIFLDLNKDGEVTTADRTYLGDINPEYFGGWNNNLFYKNLDFSFNFQFVQGNERELANSLLPFLNNTNPYSNAGKIVYDTWTPTNTNTTYARLGSASQSQINSRLVGDGSYIRLRSVSLGYNLPVNWLENVAISNVRLSFTANNLWTISDYPGLDPESVSRPRGGATVDLTRDEGYAYPLAQTFTFGLNVNF